MSLAYRPAEPEDLSFIIDGWKDSYRTSRAAGMIQMDDWDAIMADQVKKVLARPDCQTIVAYHSGETDRIADLYGFICVERNYDIHINEFVGGRHRRRMVRTGVPLVHYIFVRQMQRENGIARGLFKAAGVDPSDRFNYSCRTGVVSDLAAKIPRAEWLHLVARFPKECK